jgi:two-component system nitrate/nitrite response regulator NarL
MPTSSAVPVFIVDPNDLQRLGCKAIFDGDHRFEVLAEAPTVADITRCEGLDRLATPALMVVEPYCQSGFDLEGILELPSECQPWTILIFSECSDPVPLACSLRSGIRGYLLKAKTPGRCLPALAWALVASESSTLIDSSLATSVASTLVLEKRLGAGSLPLSPREQEILGEMIHGFSDDQIAQHLTIARTTVQSHINAIFRKTGTSSRFELGMYVSRTKYELLA